MNLYLLYSFIFRPFVDPLLSEEAVREALRSVDDPEVGMNIVDLGLVYRIAIGSRAVDVTMTMTTPACPMGGMIVDEARDAVQALLPAGAAAEIHLVWEPPWTCDMMSARAKETFGWSG